VRVLEFTPARGKVEKDQDPNLGPNICSGYFGITDSAAVNVLLTDIILDPNLGPNICSGYFGITGSAAVNVLLTDIILDS
jgi:hypothetical protein